MELLVFLGSISMILAGRIISHKKVSPRCAFFVGFSICFIFATLVLLTPGGGMDNWSVWKLVAFLFVLPGVCGLIFFVGRKSEI